MNRNIKKIIAVALMFSAFNAVIPATDFNLMTTKAYASSGELTSIKVKTSGGSTIKTYSDDDYKSKNEVDNDEMKDDETYYAKTSSNKIKISTSGVSTSHVRIFKGKSSSTKGVKASSTIELSEGSTTNLTIRTYDDDPGTVKYSDDSYTSQYTIRVKCTGSSSDSTDEDEDGDVYLKSITLSDGDLSFSKKTSTYNVKVGESVSEIKITAKPDCDSDEYDDYEVTIDGTTVDEDDKFRKSVSLSKGENKIKITVEDDDDEIRAYTLNITRGVTSTDNTNTSNNGTTTTPTVKANQWVQVNGLWQYNDSTGNSIKNNWFYDRNDGKYYYLKADGNIATGWYNNNGTWYYLNPVSGGPLGSMYTNRWAQSSDGTWYYLGASGAMVTNTTINGYKLGANGAWIR
ncbi:putative endo-beta-N-acetylglucosaminidase precursor [Clostridium puniceum]|uniref:Putative endo-beta-N-acetylglucosaminidase n=1 Tax=Clostridium puniceum TaxID=29367 RepID=A0A1S8TAG1_9CLOT|nr:cadherin-like beta sandwich domain-containing protein [Clostridium puniceum]OOM74767.1 putative endo-beta-N-acetylglucosaminidase precursor [Clostridium puniceum]